jgi:hypothetical protein
MSAFMEAWSMREQLAAFSSWRFEPARWSVYRRVLVMARERGIPFAIGGGTATMVYAGRPRQSKDLDLFVTRENRERMIQVTSDCGLRDLYDEQPYDRAWIYRAHDGTNIVDIIWAMANQRAPVDRTWLENGPEMTMEDLGLRLVPPEEILWAKLYILQRDRCDWPDALNILYVLGPELDWDRLLTRLGPDAPLLAGLLSVFAWLCPARARELPASLWRELKMGSGVPNPYLASGESRADLLDSRWWFRPATPEDATPAPAVGAC